MYVGAALIIDYGKDDVIDYSLRGIQGHQFVDVLKEPGRCYIHYIHYVCYMYVLYVYIYIYIYRSRGLVCGCQFPLHEEASFEGQ